MAFGDGSEYIKVSKLNSGMLQNFRMDFLWKDRHTHARQGNYPKWNEDLDAMWCELSGDAKKSDIDEFKTLDEAVSGELNQKRDKKGFEKPTLNDKSRIVKQKKVLMDKEIFLRRLQNKQGKGTAYNEEDDDFD